VTRVPAGYTVLETLSSSERSHVIRASRESDGIEVVLKVVQGNAIAETRFRHEAEILNLLAELDCVPRVLGVEESPGGLALVLESIGAPNLKTWMKQMEFDLGQRLRLAVELVNALLDVHGVRVIYKNLNPTNILITGEEGVKLVDFTIASRLSKLSPGLKNPEVLEGDLHYISPEQTGRMNRMLDYRSDFYSLGVVLYELLTDRLPFEGEDPLVLVHAHIAREPQPLTGIPTVLSDLILKLLEKTAEARYQTAWGIKSDLEQCFHQWERSGRIERFPLASRDVPDTFQISQKLYGREAETRALRQAFERVADGPDRGGSRLELILVAGFSGIGKSALVGELHRELAARRGYFISGKFDQFQKDIPYRALVLAFNELVQHLLSESDQRLAHWKERLAQALGPNGQVVIDLVPAVELILGPQAPVPRLGPSETQNRLNSVFQEFLRVFCSAEHPLVLFLDDLQWVDAATLKLLEAVLCDVETSHLLVLGAYRDNEVDPSHRFVLCVDRMRDKHVLIHDIHLQPLQHNDINQLISDSLYAQPEKVRPLTELVLRKTGGNPFFIVQFLQTLHQEELLHFEVEQLDDGSVRYGWVWNVDRIEAQDITENVVELMLGKLRRLPASAQESLQLAACIGNRFDLETLGVVSGQTKGQAYASLLPVLQKGLLLPVSELTMTEDTDLAILEFRFLHDRVQQAAYALTSQEQLPALHLSIGRQLHRQLNDNTDGLLFQVVDHYNIGASLMEDRPERREVAQLNLEAGQRARSSSAYHAGVQYLDHGVALLGDQCWDEQNHELSYALYAERAFCRSLAGQFDLAEDDFNTLLANARQRVDKARVRKTQMTLGMLSGKSAEGVQAGLAGLRLLGIEIPDESECEAHGDIQMEKILAGIDLGHLECLLDLPRMDNPETILATELLAVLFSTAYVAGAPNTATLCALMMVDLALEYGNSPISSFGYCCLGMTFATRGEFDVGFRLGKLALELDDRNQNLDFKAKNTNHFYHAVSPYRQSLEANIPAYREVFARAIERGDFIFASWSMVFLLWARIVKGDPLEKVIEEANTYRISMLRSSVGDMIHALMQQWRAMLRLQGGESALADFEPGFEDALSLELWTSNGFAHGLNWYYLLRLQFYYLEGRYSEADQVVRDMKPTLATNGTFFPIVLLPLYHGLTLTAMLSEEMEPEQSGLWAPLEQYRGQLATWAQSCPANFEHPSLLLEAEASRLMQRPLEAMELYDRAVEVAKARKDHAVEALANECAGRFWLRRNKPEFARLYLEKAYHAFSQWGAHRKASLLKERYPQWLSRGREDSRAISGEALDLASVVKASQALSGELVLDSLLTRMLSILMENSGAVSGSIFLETDGRWTVAASNDGKGHPWLDRTRPDTLLHFVARTGRSLVLEDAASDHLYGNDPHIREQQARSVLCYPLEHHGEIVGILYLENNLLSGAFTPQRLEMVSLLASQAAISIQNAILYNDLEIRVAERTQELAEARDEAQAATRAKSDFLANMSHEIRTPMNAVIGLTHLALGTELNRKQKDYLNKISGSANHLLGLINDILDFSKIEAGKMELESVDFDLAEVLDNLANVVSVKSVERGLELILDLDPETPLGLRGDPLRLKQILINLANNAIKFTEVGDIRIAVRAKERTKEQVVLYFEVTDTGIGMTQEQIGRLFKAFSQADSSTTRRFGGTGLGLTICKRLTELMKGEIGVTSVPGSGSTFFFTARFDLGQKPSSRIPACPEALHGMRALVVDDHPTSCIILCRQLESFGFRAESVASGHEALEELQRGESYKLVLTDWKMPVMDGLETAEKVAELFPQEQRPIILMLSAHGRQGLAEEAARLGVKEVLSKPVSTSSLLDAILNAFGHQLAPSRTHQVPTDESLRGAHLLLVEDNEINQQVAEELLNQAGIQVTIAGDGQVGVNMLLAQPDAFDAVLMDVQMPVMNGYEATREIRRMPQFRDLPVIAMTANALAGDREKAIAVGMNDHIAKPIDVAEMFKVLTQWVQVPPGRHIEAPMPISESLRGDGLPDLPGVDIRVGLQRCGSNPKLYRKLLVDFARDHGNIVERIRDATDNKVAEREAHTLKGVAGNLGATRLAALAEPVETCFRTGEGDLESFLLPTEAELEKVLRGLQELSVESHVQVASKAVDIDPEKVRALCQELRGLLEDYDGVAADVVGHLEEALGGRHADQLQRLARAVDDFDFDLGLEHLDEFETSL
jgi:predicted ATPase/signal transduction histidine kinase/DNA-binding response OmpR family regulator/HPt (histidine-containing phosphotransfer) domain-containing protein/predicted Ser/Thr protein kinase